MTATANNELAVMKYLQQTIPNFPVTNHDKIVKYEKRLKPDYHYTCGYKWWIRKPNSTDIEWYGIWGKAHISRIYDLSIELLKEIVTNHYKWNLTNGATKTEFMALSAKG